MKYFHKEAREQLSEAWTTLFPRGRSQTRQLVVRPTMGRNYSLGGRVTRRATQYKKPRDRGGGHLY